MGFCLAAVSLDFYHSMKSSISLPALVKEMTTVCWTFLVSIYIYINNHKLNIFLFILRRNHLIKTM